MKFLIKNIYFHGFNQKLLQFLVQLAVSFADEHWYIHDEQHLVTTQCPQTRVALART